MELLSEIAGNKTIARDKTFVKQSQSMKRLVMITDNEKNATSQDMI
jgi:hypothetical protein